MTGGRIASLDLLRGGAAFAVAIPHFFMYLSDGQSAAAEVISVTAVEVFFVLSGFVLAPQILLCVEQRNWQTLKIFLIRRWMRTIPPYVVALICISLILDQMGSLDFYRYFAYVSNLWAQHNAHDYFPVAWSLAVEEWYYVVFPPFLLFATAMISRKDKTACLWMALVFAAIIAAARFIHGYTPEWGENTRRVVVFRIDSIAYGFVLFLLLEHFPIARPRRAILIASLSLIVALGLTLLLNEAVSHRPNSLVTGIHPFISAAFGASAIFFFVALDHFSSGKNYAAASGYFGKISYSVYLFHLVIIYTLSSHIEGMNWAVQLGIYLTACFAISTAFFFLFERPILASRPNYVRRPMRADVATGAV